MEAVVKVKGASGELWVCQVCFAKTALAKMGARFARLYDESGKLGRCDLCGEPDMQGEAPWSKLEKDLGDAWFRRP